MNEDNLKSIRAVVSDFDGTLVGSGHKVSPSLNEAIRQFESEGKIFSIATGRAYEGMVQQVSDDLGLKNLNIVRGGSEIVEAKTGKVVWGKYIDPTCLDELFFDLFAIPDVISFAESGPDIFTKDGIGNKEFAGVNPVKKISDMSKDKVPKVAIPPLYDPEVILPNYEKLVNKFPKLHIVKTTGKKGMGMDINDGGAGKHIALLEYSRLMNILPEKILGVGDSYNDYPLLSSCGVKVAMGNAPEELKEIADIVVETQEDGGLLKLLNRINSV